MSRKEVYRIDIPIETEDKYSDGLSKAKKDVEGFEKSVKKSAKSSAKHMTGFEKAVQRTTQKINQRMDRLTKGRWSMTLRAVDRASRVIGRVSSFAQRVTRRTYRIAVRALDYATRPLRGIVSSIGSILATAGIVGGVAGGLVLPIKMTIERQNITTAFEVLLGSQKKAQKRIAELTEFAGQTPYARDEIYEASRVLEVFTKGALSTGDGLKLVGDVAAGTQQEFGDVALWMGRLYDAMASGRPVGEMTSRLQEMGAISGSARARLEALAESGKDISKTWPEVTKEFERYNGMMAKLSDNLANLLLGVKTSFMNNVIARWGQGIEKGLSPALQKFREWRKENESQITAMGDAIERYGEKITKGFMKRIEKGASYIGDLFFSDKYKNLSFGAKIKLMIDDANNAFSNWWEKTGRSQVTGLSGKMGTAFGEMLNGAIMGALGVKSDGANTYVSAGFEAGSSFVKGFIDGFDAGEVATAIGKKLLDINVEGVTSAAKGEGFGGLIGAGFVDLLALGALSSLFKPFKRIGGKAWDWTKGAGGWFWGHTFGKKGKGPEPPKGTQQVTHEQQNTTKPSQPKPVIVDQYGRPISSEGTTSTTVQTPKNKDPKFKLPKGMLNFGKRLPYVGTLLTAATLAGTSKEEMPGAVGGIAGGALGGAGMGALAGSVFPGVGTTVGAVAGGILGAFGGEKAVNWGKDKFDKFAEEKGPGIGSATGKWLGGFLGGKRKNSEPSMPLGASNQQNLVNQNLQALATWTAQASNWVVGAFQPIQGSGELINHNVTALNTWLAHASMWVAGAFAPLEGQGQLTVHNLTALNMWLAQSSSWIVGAFAPLQGSGELINHNVFALNTWLAQSSSWVVGAFQPIQGAGKLTSHNLFALNAWLAQASSWVVGAFMPIQTQGMLTSHNLSALNTWLAQSSAWVVSTFSGIQSGGMLVNHNLMALSTWLGQASSWVVAGIQPLQSNGQLAQHNLSALATWIGQASGWVVSAFQPIQSGGSLVRHNMSALATWLGRASGWVVSINGIQSGANNVKSALNGLAARIRNTNAPNIGSAGRPTLARAYAKGTNYHPGGPAIVGDGGGSELIQFPSGRVALSPATDTLVNLPRGTKVMPHHKTARIMNVPAYAEGVGTVDIPDYKVTSTSGNSVNVDVGGIQVTIVVEGAENIDTQSLNDKIVDELAEIIAIKITHAGSNMPA